MFGSITAPLVISTGFGPDAKHEQVIGQTTAVFVCPNWHTFPMLQIIEGEDERES
jgi:hypothetical protein